MTGVGRVLRYNWPRYAAAAVVIGLGLAVPLLRLASALALGWLVLGLLGTWWVYDRSPLYRWRWLLALLPARTRRYAVVSTGLDEVSGALHGLLPHADATLLDLYDPGVTREGSIRRARALTPPAPQARPARWDALGHPDATFDAVFLVFAAHELRSPAQRAALHAEVARVLRPGGRLILVEHLRGIANVVAYGPGAWHFYPGRHWRALAAGAGLRAVGQRRMTPLVHALAFQR